ncbi:Crp/Fnr family transcriptional regulator [Rhizobium sp. NFR03]|uniref:Crp/Fnr family transcriptional regulator n=1 Tax=Rhizobium sp. NFR03 TaxID=1566263 RepID=UPI0008B20EED|nr:Crp/Fnr family transcriptional regulator [Rhizobium sp. NFR03]SER80330.1 cAMP-binding domain of CRP or a regulatory subunit of cAMP-dependent protein kinases [Rhizobium sp. NFR03]
MKNGLLASLSPPDLDIMLAQLERIDLVHGQVLYQPFEKITYAYFFLGGLSSEVIRDSSGQRVEIGCVGREGLSGLPLLLGIGEAPHQAFMQIGGPALRISAERLAAVLKDHPSIRNALMKFVHTFMMQVASTALADARYTINERLARWILMAHDRAGEDDLPLTHDFLALMLGVRRPSVTTALHILEGENLIRSSRGTVTVRDRTGLERLAGGSYGFAEAEYKRVIG